MTLSPAGTRAGLANHEAFQQRLERLVIDGAIAEAIEALVATEASAGHDADTLHQCLHFYTQLGRHQRAFECAKRLVEVTSGNLDARFALANAAVATGDLALAEAELDAVIENRPGQAEAYYARSTLRGQTINRNHIDAINAALVAGSDPESEIPLAYALGKEYEDLGRWREAFAAFARGAAARRSRLSYDVSVDVDVMRQIARTFNDAWWSEASSGYDEDGPVFIFGLPRSGTTLVDRIMSSHPAASSLGENNDFTYAVMRHGSPAASRDELMSKVARSDMASLGEGYWRACLGYSEAGPKLVNNTPGNHLYLGLIAKSLPNAKIVHVYRHPVASCYAMFKSLFRMGYPFSYALDDLATYWLAYRELMDHWRSLFGDRILDVSYEELVDDQETISRELITHCGLDWDDACLHFHENAAPTATASAAQVRSPIYTSARDLWRNHESGLESLVSLLRNAGVEM
ncbi:MAG: sulfotransferase [Pseudomonadota bacterium]